MELYSNKWLKMPICVNNFISCASCATFLFLPHFDITEQMHSNIEFICQIAHKQNFWN